MTRILIKIVIIGVLVYAGFFFWQLSIPEERKILSRLEEMTECFNDARMRAFLDGVGDDYRDVSYDVDRVELQALLFRLALTARESQTNAFLFRAEWVEMPLIELTEESDRATAEFDVQFFDLSAAGKKPCMESSVVVSLEKRGGWKVVKTDFTRVRGKLRF